MRAADRFQRQSKSFWADIRTIGEAVGYTARRQSAVASPTMEDIQVAYGRLGLSAGHLIGTDGLTRRGRMLLDYFQHRATVLNEYVEPRLMDVDRARREFELLRPIEAQLSTPTEQAAW